MSERSQRMTVVMTSLAFVVAVVALATSIVAYQQSGMGIDEKVKLTLEEDQAELKRELAVADAKMTLFAIRTEIAAGRISETAADEIARVRNRLEDAYADTTGAVKDSWQDMDVALSEAEMNVRDGGAEAIASIEDALSSLRESVSVSSQELCVREGGEWKEFPNACADTCDSGTVCAQVLTMSCDCGPDACWNGLTCEPAA